MVSTANRLGDVKEYYFSKKLREVASLRAAGKQIISLGIGSPDLTPDKSVLLALNNASKEVTAHGYQSYQGLPALRQAMSSFYENNFKVALDPEKEVLPLMGSKEGIMHVSMAFLNPGDQVLVPNPGYPTYTSVTKLVGAEPVFYDLVAENKWLPDFEALEKLDLSKVKIMWINYPHMPTGATAKNKVYDKLIAFAKKHKILLVNDNPYSFVLNDNPESILKYEGAKEVALELNSLSKSFNMAGWRVGMFVGASTYLAQILKVKSNMDSGMFYGIQKGAIEALHLSKDWFKSINEHYHRRREIVYQILDELNCVYDTSHVGMFVWAKLPEGITSEQMTDKMLYEKDVFITPGTVFGSNGEGYVRLSLCVSEENLKEVLARVKA
ncbi:pyridoxal phosphate-dependent aminotransferase [Wenyingzhuangia sp. 2_MG-2023]|uniref:pyridoxal phosphate-dependent aminotransferase n=1 Tax=Wenyingzhuangia sp. 2_MG-2023 TaxID=3062639 RepID=UPI0026E36B61|nr:aminotransferase class I/II-fold pyridoxal phosphate-dependent enzyme [Wenyingzhuangia sp. 2_MG-2023]MDO6737899.1 aminotransferase class I/II-fold pyridoxal phosphate-dependent enzyme [Wenyingzhuangia sp. 2_MG-2023]